MFLCKLSGYQAAPSRGANSSTGTSAPRIVWDVAKFHSWTHLNKYVLTLKKIHRVFLYAFFLYYTWYYGRRRKKVTLPSSENHQLGRSPLQAAICIFRRPIQSSPSEWWKLKAGLQYKNKDNINNSTDKRNTKLQFTNLLQVGLENSLKAHSNHSHIRNNT